jgi:ATP-dependent protease ClpP protease subunit
MAEPRLTAWKTTRQMVNLRQGRNDWYRITDSAADVAEVYVYDEIGFFGVSAADFVRDLAGVSAPRIDLHLNTPGGSIFDGIAIYNGLRHHPARVTSIVDSLAASIGSVIAMAGDEIVMAEHSQMMIHDGLGMAIGNADDMRETAELLERQSDNIAGIYAARAGGTPGQWRERMRAETWYTDAEAVRAGLADRIGVSTSEPVGSWDLSIFNHAGRENAPGPDRRFSLDPAAIARAFKEAGNR